VLPSNAKAVEACGPPPRRASNRHRKQGKGRMGNFANAAAQYDLDKRGDGHCVSGRWIADNLDEDDLKEFIRLSNGHRWELILRLSGDKLRSKSLIRHVHGTCPCFDGVAAKGCCTSCNKAES
jgi:hypothetical protein